MLVINHDGFYLTLDGFIIFEGTVWKATGFGDGTINIESIKNPQRTGVLKVAEGFYGVKMYLSDYVDPDQIQAEVIVTENCRGISVRPDDFIWRQNYKNG